MNEKLQYAEMLEIPVNTCSITYKPPKKRRGRSKKQVDAEAVKEQLMEKVNATAAEDTAYRPQEETYDVGAVHGNAENAAFENMSDEEYVSAAKETSAAAEDYQTVSIRPAEKKKRGKFGIVAVQLCLVGALIATIFLTNALVPNSGINTFMRGVFGGGTKTVATDERLYSEFNPVLPVDGVVPTVAEDGVMTFAGEGSLYSPCDGKIASVTQTEDGKFTLEITHSENFKTVFTGVDYAYVSQGDTVFSNIPVGYVLGEEVKLCFYGENGTVITDYSVDDNSVIWAV